MGYLGLTEPLEKEENLFQRLFWPSYDPATVDDLGRQGCWLCIVAGVSTFVILLGQGHWAIGFLSLIFYVLGGMGVREHSVGAATLVGAAYIVGLSSGLSHDLATAAPPVMGSLHWGLNLRLMGAFLLLANMRGTWIAAQGAKRRDTEDLPQRKSLTWHDRLVDQLPQRIWPEARIFFYAAAVTYLTLASLEMIAMARRALAPSHPQTQSMKINVGPGT